MFCRLSPELGRPGSRRAYLLPAVLLALVLLVPLLATGLAEMGSAAAQVRLRQSATPTLDRLHRDLVSATFDAAPALALTPPVPTSAWLLDQLHPSLPATPSYALTVTRIPTRHDQPGSAPHALPPLAGARRQLTAGLTLATDNTRLPAELTLWSLPAATWCLAGNVDWDPSRITLALGGGSLLATPPDETALPTFATIPTPGQTATHWAYDLRGRPVALPDHAQSPGWRWLAPADFAADPATGAAEADCVVIDLVASLTTPSSWPPPARLVGSWSIGGQEGSFGATAAPAAPPFAGLRVTGGPFARLYVDLGEWDGPSRLYLRGDAGLIFINGSATPHSSPVRIDADSPGASVTLLGPNFRPAIVQAADIRLDGTSPWHGALLVRGQLRLAPPAPDGELTLTGVLAGNTSVTPIAGSGHPTLRLLPDPDLSETLRRAGLDLPSWILLTVE